METDPAFFDVIDVWLACRGAMGGLQHLPERGAVMDQGAWLMDALMICQATTAWLELKMPLRRRA